MTCQIEKMSKLQTLVQFWQGFNLPQVQQGLDEVATQITARQDESDNSRKILIDLIRDFKKDNTEEIRSAVGPLVKAFQNEVDALSRRSKSSEKAFFDIYKQLVDVADPSPILDSTLERLTKQSSKLQDYEIEVQQLRETLGDYNVQMQELKAKEKKLSELQNMVAQYDRNIDETLNERLKSAKEKLQTEFDERVRIIDEEKQIIERRMADQEVKLKNNQRQLESVQTELFEVTSKVTEKAEAKSDEAELLLNDLESSQQRAALAEKEIDALKEQIRLLHEGITNGTSDNGQLQMIEIAKVEDLNCQLSLKDREVSQLLSDLQQVKQERESEVVELQEVLDKVQTEKDDLEKKVQSLTLKLEAQADYVTIKKDLAILKSLEFSSFESCDDGDVRSEGLDNKPLEVMILERSKALQADNTNLRLERDRLSSELGRVSHELEEKTSLSERQGVLIAELEEHVEKLQDLSNVNRGEAEGRSSTDFLVAELDLGSDTDSPPRLMMSRSSLSPGHMSSDQHQKSLNEASSLLPIVQAQRERFRKRNEELEEEQSKLSSQIFALQSEVSDLQTDNVKLYEKIRFLQGFQSSKQESVSIPIETKYKQQYEKKLDPFTTFSNQEKQRKYAQLNIVEKIILSMVQFMLSNKSARIFVFAYSILLHGLVFVVLMNQALSESYRRDLASSVEWQQRYLDHMNEEHAHHTN